MPLFRPVSIWSGHCLHQETKGRVLSRLSHPTGRRDFGACAMLASGAPCVHQQSMRAAPNARRHWHDEDLFATLAGWRTVRLRGRAFDRRHRARAGRSHGRRTRSRRSAAGPATRAAGSRRACRSRVAESAGHPIAGASGAFGLHDAGPVRGARRRDLLQGRLVPPGMPIPGGREAAPPLPAPVAPSACTTPVSVRGTRRRDLLQGRLVPAGHADPGRPRRPRHCRRQWRLRPARRRTRSRRSAAGPADKAGWFPPGMPIPVAERRPRHCRRQRRSRPARRRTRSRRSAAGPLQGGRYRRAWRYRAAKARPRPNPLWPRPEPIPASAASGRPSRARMERASRRRNRRPLHPDRIAT